MRKLIYIPIIHTEIDLGSFNEELKKQYLEKFGLKQWNVHIRSILHIWEGLKERIKKLKLDYKKVKIYQDGLPLCGKEEKIVRELALKKSPNHELILWLMEQGGELCGTEDPDLLLKEYQLLKSIQVANPQERKKMIQSYEKEAKVLLRKRDSYIARRIHETLKEDEVGILFIGLLHRVDEYISPDISVSYLIHRLPFYRNFEIKKIYG